MEGRTWGLWALTAIVIGNMVGSGIFSLPSSLASTSSPLATIFAWGITAVGVLFIALVYGNLAVRKPELKAGPQSHAMAAFKNENTGQLAGYSMVWGYWVANWASNGAIITSFSGYLSTFFPIMRNEEILFSLGNFDFETGKVITFIVCTAILWGTHTMLVFAHQSAGKINLIATGAKVLGFILFICLALFAIDPSNFNQMYTPIVSEAGKKVGLAGQINGALISTLWAYIGVESAILLSGRAKRPKDIKTATILGLGVATLLYISITLLTIGSLPLADLQNSDKPLADALTHVIGPSAGNLMALVAIVALTGSIIGWIIVSAEAAFQGSTSGIFFPYFKKVSKRNAPVRALTVTNIMTQFFLLSILVKSISEAYGFIITVATLAYLIPYLVSPLYQLLLVYRGETYGPGTSQRIKDGFIALMALVFSLYVIKTGTGDLKTFMLGIGLYFAGFLFYPLMKFNKNNNKHSNKLAN